MINKIAPIHFSARWESRGHGRSRLCALMSRIWLTVEVELAPQGKDVSPQGQPPGSSQTVRQAKIAALKRAITDGIYSVSGEQLADRMLAATLVDLLV
jgi:hypothetical protein